MKTIKLGFLALLLAAAFNTNAALPDPQSGFGLGTTNPATALSYVVVPARSANNGAPAVTFLNAGSAAATAKVQFYQNTTLVSAKYATNATVLLHVERTNGFASGDVIIIRHKADETYEKRILTTMTTATNLTTTVAPVGAVVPGDIIYRAQAAGAGSIQWGAITNSLSGSYIYVGQKGQPLLAEINGTSTDGLINAIGGIYLP